MKEQISIDFLFMVGGKGGFEASVNRTADHLISHGCKVRFIQVVSTDSDWATANADFYCLGSSQHINIEECASKYIGLLSDGSAPDLIIVAGMPHMIYIAKRAIVSLQLPIPIAAWPHNDLYFYDDISKTADALSYAEFFFAISDKIARDAEMQNPALVIYRVNNSIDPDTIAFSQNRNTNRFAFVGRLSEEKNVDLIIKAISKTSCCLTIIGDGEQRETLQKLSDNLGCSDRITFAGWQDRPWDLVQDHRALIMASSTEGSPLTCIEALACGMQVVSTPVASIPDIIIPEETGYTFPLGSVDDLSRIITSLSAKGSSPETSEKCRQSISEFMPDFALSDFYKKVLASANLTALPQRNWRDSSIRWCKQ